jgi:uncharacterized spore protein YtfJ
VKQTTLVTIILGLALGACGGDKKPDSGGAGSGSGSGSGSAITPLVCRRSASTRSSA